MLRVVPPVRVSGLRIVCLACSALGCPDLAARACLVPVAPVCQTCLVCILTQAARPDNACKACGLPRSRLVTRKPQVGSGFAKGMADLLGQRRNQILHHRPFSGLQEGLDRHAGDQVNLPQTRQFGV